MTKGEKHQTKNNISKYLLISIHDVTPFYEKEVYRILESLKKRRIRKINLLITPNWHEEGNITNAQWNINKYPEFIKTIRKYEEQGAEIALHGYDHNNELSRTQNHEDAKEMLNKSIKLFKKAFKKEPKGYIPPMWSQSNAMHSLVKQKFNYTESYRQLEYFSGNMRICKGFVIGMEGYYSTEKDRITPSITKILSNIYARTIWNKNGVVRYSIHPREANNGNFYATFNLLDKFLEKNWKPITYSELESIE